MAREYFPAYHSYLEVMEALTDAEKGRLFTACLTAHKSGRRNFIVCDNGSMGAYPVLPISFSFLHPAAGDRLPGIYASPRRMRRAVAPAPQGDRPADSLTKPAGCPEGGIRRPRLHEGGSGKRKPPLTGRNLQISRPGFSMRGPT